MLGESMKRLFAIARRYLICVLALVAIVAVNRWIVAVNATTVALYMLLVVLGAATRWGLAEAVFTSGAGMLSFNYFFLPPVGTFTINDPENWVALFAFLATAITASKLSTDARRQAGEALTGRNEIGRLYELSRALLMDEGGDAIRHSVVQAGQILGIREIAFFDAAAKQTYGWTDDLWVSPAELALTADTGEPLVRPGITVIPVQLGTRVIGSLAFGAGTISENVRESIANLLAINYERAHALGRAATAEIARRNEEFKSSLLDGMAHDLKTPLTAIRSCITRLIQIPPRTEEVRQELLSIIDQESLRLQASITEAIELARIESRELHLAPERTDVARLVETAIMDGRDENRARYSVDIPPGLEVVADPELLRRALMQILENAKKYSPSNAPIVVRARQEDKHTTIAVLDRGTGIASDEIERIFNKFYRGRKGRDKAEGTGMGLAIAKAIVNAHQGRIYAENRGDGAGAAIIIKLP
jgi:two-component system sensor histidine kinase KdpD